MNQKTFVFIGRSGCGKGTQAKLLSDYLKKIDNKEVLYIQTGSEIREFIKGDSETQKIANGIYATGGLFPEFITVYMWIRVLIDKYTKNEHIIFDGTPRKVHEAGVLNSIFEFYTMDKPYVIYINVSKDESINRLMKRGRVDDNREDIEARLSWFETDVIPAIDYYRNNNSYNLIEIDGMKTVEEIHNEIVNKLALK